MENYFKKDNVDCQYKNSCRNKSKSFCSECSRNFNRRVVRDWFDPTEEYNYILKKLSNDESNLSNDEIDNYKLKFSELTEEEKNLLIDFVKDY